jgi:Skp family chaperone for outer membrane proteins
VLQRTCVPTPSEPFVRSFSQSRAERQWIGNAAIAFATLATSVLASTTVSAQQAESRHQLGHRMAVLDVAYIFKNLPAITAQVSKIEGDLKKYDAEFKQKRDTLKQSAAELETLKAGTADYARKQEHVANLESKLRLEIARKKKELAAAEAKIYFDNYQRIAAAVKAIATHNNIKLVLRFNSEEMDLERGDSVLRGVMKNIVYHDSTINITDTVMRYLEQQMNTSRVATGGTAASATSR